MGDLLGSHFAGCVSIDRDGIKHWNGHLLVLTDHRRDDGRPIWESYTLQNYPQIVVGMVLIGLLGMLSSLLVRKLGYLLMPWTRRGGATA